MLSLQKQNFKNVGRGPKVSTATIACTLKVRAPKDSKPASTTLKSFISTDGSFENHKQVKDSFDHLNNDEAKKLLLLSSLFPEDYEIPVETLTRFGIGLDLFENVYSFEATRRHVDQARAKLIDSGLLMAGEDGCVKMQSFVRASIRQIANKENQLGILDLVHKKDDTVEKHKTNTIRYLYCRGIFTNDLLDWTKLEIFILADVDEGFVEVQEEFFKRMENLRVLSLACGKEWEGLNLPLPRSVRLLKSLQTLSLENFKLAHIDVVVDLPSLAIFELRDCFIGELPIGIVKLENLRLLSMVDCKFEQNPYKVIGQLSSLQELYFKNIYKMNSRETWELNKEAVVNLFSKGIISTTLQRYHIEIRDGSESYGWGFDGSISRALAIQYFDPGALNAPIMDLVGRAECVDLLEIQGGYKAIIPDVIKAIGRDMNELTSFTLYSCSEIQYLIHAPDIHSWSMAKTIFSKLVDLYLCNMDELKTLCYCYSYNLQELSFRRLKKLCVWCCPALTSLFMLSAAQSLVALEEMIIIDCKELKYIIDKQSAEEEIVKDEMFPKLKALIIYHCDRLAFIFPNYFVGDLPLLETIDIFSCDELKSIFGQCQLEDWHQNGKEIILPSLEIMELGGVPKFINMFQKCGHPNPMLLSAQRFASRDSYDTKQQSPHKRHTLPWAKLCCLSHTYEHQLRGSTNTEKPIVSKVEDLDFTVSLGLQASNSGCVNHFGTNQCLLGQSLILRDIKRISLIKCGEITSLFSLSFATKMLLEKLSIEECHGMKHVITFVGNGHDRTVFPKLKHFSVENCSRLEYIFGHNLDEDQNHNIEVDIELPALETLQLENLEKMVDICSISCNVACPSLKEFFVDTCRQFIITSTTGSVVHFDATQMDCTTTKMSNPENLLQCLPRQSTMLQNVQRMNLTDCGKIESLFTMSIASTMLLEELKIDTCNELKYIITDMSDNHSNISIFPKLKELTLKGCSKLIFMVGQYHDESPNRNTRRSHLDFPALQVLSLQDLPNMVGICLNNCHVMYPSLNTLSMDLCPKFAIKSISDFMVHWEEILMDRTKDLEGILKPLKTLDYLHLKNFQIEDIFCLEGLPIKDGEQISLSLRVMKLHDLHGLKYIWRGLKSFLNLENLNELQIEGCQELQVIFSVSILRTIPMLKKLMLVNCQKLEKIVEENEESGVSPEICFPELMVLVVKNCNSLKHMLSISTFNEFPKLESLAVAEAYQLEQAFRPKLQYERVGEEPKPAALPSLRYLMLVNLPNLTNVCRGFELESVQYRAVLHCNSNITPSSTADCKRFCEASFGFDDLMGLDSQLCGQLKELLYQMTEVDEDSRNQDATIENSTRESTAASSRIGTENLNSEMIEPSSTNGQPSSQEEPTNECLSEPSSKNQKQSIEIMEEISLEEYSKSKEVDHKEELMNVCLSEPSSKNQQQPLGENENNNIEKMEEHSVEEYSKWKKFDHKEKLVDEQLTGEPSPKVEEDAISIRMPTVPVILTENLVNKENLVTKVLDDLEILIKMPLKDLVASEHNKLCLYTALNFLSHLSCEDDALPNELKYMINALYQDFPGILSSFKEAFTVIKKFAELEEGEKSIEEELERQKKKVISLDSVYPNMKRIMDETVQNEAILKEQINRLQVELESVKEKIKGCEASLSSVQEQKNQCVADMKGMEKKFESVKKDKHQMVEDQRKAQQVLTQTDFKWSQLCSRFEMSRMAARNSF